MSPRVHLLSDTTGPVNAVCLSQLLPCLKRISSYCNLLQLWGNDSICVCM